MSDPVTNVEVEDVLSSIRRLVSDDKRPSMTAAPSSDRLVLTPALRVADSDDDAGSTDVETQIQAWSEFGASPEDTGAQAEGDAQETVHSHEEDEGLAEQEAQGENHADSNDENDDDLDDSKPDPFILEFPAETQTEEHVNESAKDTPEAAIPDAELLEDQGEAAFFANSAATLSAKIAALETVIGKTDDQWEPDDTGDSDYSGTEAPAMVWDDVDEAETDALDATAGPDTATDAEPEAGFGQSVDSILDEEALRDLVSDIVREELQGALGERITRNVRKLVRREIHRALAAQELE